MFCACERKPEPEAIAALPEERAIATQAGPGSGSQHLSVGLDGSIVLSWIEPVDDATRALKFRRLAGDRWSAPATVVQSDAMFVNWADVPTVTTDADGDLVATWLEYHGKGHSYGIRWSTSTDGGTKWSPAADLAADRSGPEYGFVSFARTSDDALAVYWLDSRAQGMEGHPMQLRSASIDRAGRIGDGWLVDDRVCDCCQTSAAATGAGPVVAYRDRSEEEIRDIRLAGPRRGDVRLVAADAWMIAGCPVNGPAVATMNDRIAVAWFTAAADDPKVQVAFATNDGPFATPTRVDVGPSLGRVDLEWIDADTVVVAFLSTIADSDRADIVVRTVTTAGTVGRPLSVARTAASSAAGFPRLARSADHLLVTWTQSYPPAPTSVTLTETSLSSLPR